MWVTLWRRWHLSLQSHRSQFKAETSWKYRSSAKLTSSKIHSGFGFSLILQPNANQWSWSSAVRKWIWRHRLLWWFPIMLCAAGLMIISVQTRVDVLQSHSFSPSSVWTKYWSSGAVCESSASSQSAAQLTTRDVKQSRRETRRWLRNKGEKQQDNTLMQKIPPTKQNYQNNPKVKIKWSIMNTNDASSSVRAGSSTCRYRGAHCLIICPHGYEPGLQGEPWHNMKMRLPKKHQQQSSYSSFTGFI